MSRKMQNWMKNFMKKSSSSSNTSATVQDFCLIWEKHRKNSRKKESFVENVIADVKEKITKGCLSPENVVKDAIEFTKLSKDSGEDELRNRQILIGLVDILATNQVESRPLVRQTLELLFKRSKCIDRAVLFFDQAELLKPVMLDNNLLAKQSYILGHTAGWVVQGKAWQNEEPIKYLELPFRRASSNANSNIMAEALYRQQDPDFVLRLLQHGLQPSCLYLWPTCILIDLKFTIHDFVTIDEEEIRNTSEAVMVRYFCRARHYIHVHVVKTEDRGETLTNLPEGLAYDDILLVPPRAIGIVPDARFRFPSSLQHQCRLRIRKSLLAADCLPRGIYQLPIPKALMEFLNLLID